jgi:hypothetical protein
MGNLDWREAVDVCRVPAYEIGQLLICAERKDQYSSPARHTSGRPACRLDQ